jgi:D-glycero-beta-D-manno-heptose-7-phosphate kinase
MMMTAPSTAASATSVAVPGAVAPTLHVERERLAQARVLVVGDAMLDRYWFGAVERISPEAPVPVVRVQREEERLGGAANVALNVKTLGAQCTLLTVVGDDEPARILRRLLEEQGVATVLGSDPRLYTIVKLRVIGRSQQLIRVDFENQPEHEVLDQMLADYERVLADHDAVLFSDYGKELARAAGKPVLIDPKGSDYQRYRGATVITPNRAELAQVVGHWSGEADLEARARGVRERFDLAGLLVTRSEEGMSLYEDAATPTLHVPAQAREVFDVTGAGDTVIASLAALLACGLTLRQAVPLANRAGAIVVGKFGTASVSYDELFGAA